MSDITIAIDMEIINTPRLIGKRQDLLSSCDLARPSQIACTVSLNLLVCPTWSHFLLASPFIPTQPGIQTPAAVLPITLACIV